MSGMKVAKARKSLPTSNRKQLASLHRTSNVVGQPDCGDRIFLLTAEVLEYGSDIDGSLENTSSSEILKIDGSEPDVLLCRITSIQGQVMDSENSDTQFGNEAEDVLLYKVTSVQSRQDAMEQVLDEDNAQTSIKEQMCSPENTLIRENGCSFQEDFGMGIDMMSNETHNGIYQSAESNIICTMVDSIDSSLEGHCEVSILDDTRLLEQETMTQNIKNPAICLMDPPHFMDPSSSNRNGNSCIQKALEENPLLKPFLSQSKDERSTGLIKKVPTKCGCGIESPTLRNLLQNDRGLNLESQLQHDCHNVKNAKCDHKYDDANVQEVHIYVSKIPEMLSDASKAPAIQTDVSVLKMQTDRCETLKILTSDSEATQKQTGGSEAPQMQTGGSEAPKMRTGVTEAPKIQTGVTEAPKMQANNSVAPKKWTAGSEAPMKWTASSEALKKWTAGSEAPKNWRDGSEALAKLPDGSEVPAKLPDGSEAPEKQTSGSEVPHNGTSGSGEPHEGTSVSRAPHGGTGSSRAPNEGTGSSGAPHHGTGGSGAPHDGTSGSRAPHNGTGSSGAPHDGTGGSGAPQDGTGGSGAPHDGTGGSGAPHDGTGGSGSPHDGTGGSGSPHDGTGGSGAPHDGTGGSGAPHDGTGGSGAPHDSTGGSGEPHDGTGGSGEPHDGTGSSGAPHDGTGGSGGPHDGTGGPEAPQEGTSCPKASQKRTGDSEALKMLTDCSEAPEMLTDSSEAFKLVTGAPEEPKMLTHSSEAQMLTDGSEALAVSISGTTALEMQPVNVKATWILLGDASTQDLQPSQLGDTNVQQDRLDYNAMQLIESSPHGMQPECMDFNVEHILNESILPLKRQMSREPICDESEDCEQNKSKRICISSIEHNSPMEGGEQQLTSIEKVIRAIFEKNFGGTSPHIVIEEIQKINGQLENKNQKLAKYEKLTNIVQDKLKCAERKVVTVLQTLKKRKRMLQNAQVPQMTSMPLLAKVTSMVQGVAIPSSSSPAHHRRLDNAQDMQMQNSSVGPPVQPMNMTSSGQNASSRLRTAIPPRQSPMSVQTSPQLGGFRYAPGTSNIPNRTPSDPAVKVSTHNYVDNQTGVSIAVLPNRVDGLISGNTSVPRRWRNQVDAMTQEKIVGPSQMASKPPERQSNQQSSTMTVRDMISMVRSSSQTVTEGAVSHPRPTLSLAPLISTALSSSTNDHAAIPQHPTQTGPPHTQPMEGPIVIDDEPNNVRAPPTSTRTTSWTRPNTDGSFQPTQGATPPGAFSSPALRLVSTRGSVSQGVPGRGSGITSIQPSTGTFADSSVPTGRPGTFRSAGSTTENRNHVNEVVDGGPVPPRSLPAGSLRSPNTQHPPSSKEMPSAAPVVQEIAPSTDAIIDLTLDEDRMHQGNAARRAPTARNQLPTSSRGHPPLLQHGSQVSPNRGPVSSTQGVRSVQLASGGSHLPPPVPAHPPPPPQPVHLAPPAPPPPPSLVESDVISTLRTTRFPNVISNVRMPRVSQPSNAARITQPSSVFPMTRGPPALLNVTNSAQLRPMMTHSGSVVSVPSTNSTSPRNIPEFSSRPAQSHISSYRRIAPSQSVVCPKQMSLGSNNFVRPNFQPAMPRHPPPSYMGVSQTVTGLAPATHGASLIDTLPARMQYEQRGSSTQTAGMRGSAEPSGPVVPPSSQHTLQMVGGRDVAASYALPFPNSRFGSFPGPGISQSSTTGIPQSVATVRQHPVTQQVDLALIPLQIANTQTSLAASVTFTNTSTISAGCNRTVVPSQPTLNPSAQTSLTASGMALRTGQNVPHTVPHSNHVLPPPTYAGSSSQMGPPPATCGPPPAQAPPSEASIRHPPPLPNTPPLSVPIPHDAMGTLPPPRPLLKLGRADNQGAIVLQWSVAEPVQESTTPHRAPAESYHIYAYHEDIQQGAATQWKKIGDVQALPLPMACTLTQFMVGSRYYFTVRAKDAFGRFSPFCEPQCADLKA